MKTHNNFEFNKNELLATKRGYEITKEGVVLNKQKKPVGHYNNKGYFRFTLKKDNKTHFILAHRLQAYQKYGDRIYEDNILVRHLDGNCKNNSYSNIALGTNKENMLDRGRENVIKQALYASSFTKKYDNNSIKEYYNKTKSYKKTKDKFNIYSSGTLWHIINKSVI